MSIESKSPVYWEELKELGAADLKAAFDACASVDMPWAVDQAKTLSYNVWDSPEKLQIISEFCQEAAGKSLENGDSNTAMMALKVAAGQDDVDGQEAAEQLHGMLCEIAKNEPQRALEMAAYIQSSSDDDSPIFTKLNDFVIDVARQSDSHKVLYNLVISDKVNLSAEQLSEIADRACFLASDESYDSYALISALLNTAPHLGGEERQNLLKTQKGLAEKPTVIKGILENEYGEELQMIKPSYDSFIVPGSNALN